MIFFVRTYGRQIEMVFTIRNFDEEGGDMVKPFFSTVAKNCEKLIHPGKN